MSTITNNESNIRKVPSELQKDEKFEHCVETTLRKTTIGLLTSVIPALLVRGNMTRVAVLAFGAGIGFGMGYTECRLLYEKNISFQKKYIATIQVNNEDQKSH
jgi:uncharacterized membrane protein